MGREGRERAPVLPLAGSCVPPEEERKKEARKKKWSASGPRLSVPRDGLLIIKLYCPSEHR